METVYFPEYKRLHYSKYMFHASKIIQKESRKDAMNAKFLERKVLKIIYDFFSLRLCVFARKYLMREIWMS